MDLATDGKSAMLGNAILFVGAGFSQGAKNLRDHKMKTGKQITEHFSGLTGLPASVGLEELADEIINSKGVDFLLEELKQEFTARELSVFQTEAASVPWKRIYTTNYDNVIEAAFASVGRSLHSVTLSDPLRDFPKDKPICVHLNGSIQKANRTNLLSEIKLTETSYLSDSVANSKWATLFRQDLAAADSVFYLGYSLWDLDIKRILFESSHLRAKSFFSLGPSPQQALSRKIERFGTNTLQSSEDTVRMLSSIRVTDADRAAPLYHALEVYTPESSAIDVSDKDVFDLLLYGRLNSNFLWRTARNEASYCVTRQVADKVVTAILQRSSSFVLHSRLGNGKTISLALTCAKAYDAGIKVFILSRHSEELFKELEQALVNSGKLLFVIDNYPDWMEALAFLGSHEHSRVSLLLSARSATHDALVPKLNEVLHSISFSEVPLDRLGVEEVSELTDYLNKFGVWGDRAIWSDRSKMDFITDTCKGTWQNLLLKLLESPHIGQRLAQIISAVSSKSPYGDVLIKIIILTVSGYPVSTNDLADVCGAQVLESAFRRDDAVKELVDFSKDEINFRSAIAGEYLLKHIADQTATVGALISLLQRLDDPAFAAVRYFAIFKGLIRYSNMQLLLPQSTAGRLAMYVYENVKTLKHCEEQPLFWLQYAIACSVQNEFGRADTYFKNAYSYAKKLDWFDTYQIDNYFARFLLQRSIAFSTLSEGIVDFRNARKLILAQVNRERLHYTYSVASLISSFYDAYQTKINPTEKREIAKASEQICEIIAKLPISRQSEIDITRCYEALQKTIALVSASEMSVSRKT